MVLFREGLRVDERRDDQSELRYLHVRVLHPFTVGTVSSLTMGEMFR